MKCPDLHRRVMFGNPHASGWGLISKELNEISISAQKSSFQNHQPVGWGWEWDQLSKCLVRNYMKHTNLHKSNVSNPTLWGRMEWPVLKKRNKSSRFEEYYDKTENVNSYSYTVILEHHPAEDTPRCTYTIKTMRRDNLPARSYQQCGRESPRPQKIPLDTFTPSRLSRDNLQAAVWQKMLNASRCRCTRPCKVAMASPRDEHHPNNTAFDAGTLNKMLHAAKMRKLPKPKPHRLHLLLWQSVMSAS